MDQTNMDQIKRYKWILIIVVAALLLSLAAAYSGAESEDDFFGTPAWGVPLASLVLSFFLGGAFSRGGKRLNTFNSPMAAIVGVVLCIISGLLLFVPPPVQGLEWWYPMIAGFLLAVISNISEP